MPDEKNADVIERSNPAVSSGGSELQLAMKIKPKEDFALSSKEFHDLMELMPDGGDFLVTVSVDNGIAIGLMSPKLYELYRSVEGTDRTEIQDCIRNSVKDGSRVSGARDYRSDNMEFRYYLEFPDPQLNHAVPDPVIRQALMSDDYSFLKTDPHLGSHIALLCVAGSRAYGLNTEDSDLDIRGCAMNSKEEILTGDGFRQIENRKTDTVIYSFNKLISLLSASNPNVLELLGLRSEDYLYISDIGQEILSHKNLFLSKQVAKTFGGYANAQMKRIRNGISGYDTEQEALDAERMQIESGIYDLHNQYDSVQNGKWTDLKLKRERDGNILVSSSFNSVPIQDISDLCNETKRILHEAKEKGQRNSYAENSGRLCKHMMHLFRLYFMCIDILKTGEIKTYRNEEHDFLMDVRNGKYLGSDGKPTKEMDKMVDQLENEMHRAENASELPDKPDIKKIDKFKMRINERIVLEHRTARHIFGGQYEKIT